MNARLTDFERHEPGDVRGHTARTWQKVIERHDLATFAKFAKSV